MAQDPVEDAAAKLAAFLRWVKVIETYAGIWPGRFQRDRKRGLGMWEMVQSFWSRLGQFFPIAECDPGAMDSEWEDWASEYIPYELPNPYEEDGFDDWESLTAKVLHDFCSAQEDSWKALEQIVGRELTKPADWTMDNFLDSEQFEQKVRALPGGKSFLKAFQLVRHETDMPLLDMTYEDMGESEDKWDVETVRLAIQAGKEASRFQRDAECAIRRYDAHPERLAQILEQVVAIWRDCTKEKKL